MTRFLSLLRLDFTLQFRYGFYYAALFAILVWLGILQIVPEQNLDIILPLVIFTDLGVIGFYFLAGQIIFEKSEGTLNALVVTPLSFKEYLAAKLVSFTFLAWGTSIIVVLSSRGLQFDFFIFSLGVILMSVITLLIGFYAIIPYQSISSFIIPSQVYFIVLGLPIVHLFGLVKTPLFYLLPTQGALLVLRGAFSTLDNKEVIYALLHGIVWVSILIHLTTNRFERYVVLKKGGIQG